MNGKMIDARGLSCPEPVLMAGRALKEHADTGFTVAVSSATARDNVTAFLTSKGLSPSVEEKPGEWLIAAPGK